MHQASLFERNAQDLIGHLGECGFHALAVRVRANAKFKTSVGRYPGRTLLVPRHHWNPPAGIDGSPMGGLF